MSLSKNSMVNDVKTFKVMGSPISDHLKVDKYVSKKDNVNSTNPEKVPVIKGPPTLGKIVYGSNIMSHEVILFYQFLESYL